MPGKSHYAYKADLDHEVKADLAKGKALNGGKCPTILIMGAKGRCGGGAKDLCKEVGIPNSSLVEWDLLETKDRPGPYPEIRDADACKHRLVILDWQLTLSDIRQLHLLERENQSIRVRRISPRGKAKLVGGLRCVM